MTATQKEAGSPGEGQEYTITNERDAATALVGLLDWGDTDDDPVSPPESDEGDADNSADEADTGAEDQPTGEGDEGDSEPATPAIEPPSSWSAEDKAVFATLPPEAQQIVARRESERDKAISQRMQESADLRKAAEADRTAFEGRLTQYNQNLQSLAAMVLPELEQYARLDWVKLAAENPAAVVQHQARYAQLQRQAATVDAEMAKVRQQQAQEMETQRQARLVHEQAQLVSKVADFGDEVKAAPLRRQLLTFLQDGYGFSPQESGSNIDHRLVHMAVDLMRLKAAEAARKTGEAKRDNPPPRVQKPSNGNAGRSDDSTPNKRVREGMSRLTRSGSVRDAASIFETLI